MCIIFLLMQIMCFHSDPCLKSIALKDFLDTFLPMRVKNLQIYTQIGIVINWGHSKRLPWSTGADLARGGHWMAPAIRLRVKISKFVKQGQRQLGLDFIWDNGQLTWINKQLGSTIDQDKKIHWDWQSTWINNWLGLTVNYCSTFTDPSQHIYCIIAVCLKHYCSTYMVPFKHIYNTIAAHLLHHCSTFNYSNIAEYKI